MSTKKGLILSVYRSGGCATNGQTSGNINGITLIGNGVPEIFEPSDRAPAMFLVNRGKDRPPIIVPEEDARPMQYMAGGNFAWSCDSRFRELVRTLTGGSHDGPIQIFDRDEAKMAAEPFIRFFNGLMQYRSGEVEWSAPFAFMLSGNIEEGAAMDFIAAHEFGNAARDELGAHRWVSEGGRVAVWPLECSPINRRDFETLVANRVARRDVAQEAYLAWAAARGDADALVIYSPNEAALSDGGGYWSNEDGWGGLESATRYNRSEAAMIRPHRMPVSSGGDSRFVPAVAA